MHEMDEQGVRLFGELIDLPEEQREEYLNEHCADPETRERVSQLLGHHEALGEFMAEKAVDAFPEVVRAAGENVAEFKLIREIGRGGMGVVYLAEDTILGRTVALKMISGYSGRSEQARSRFRQEAKAAGKLSHPGIVSVYRFDDSIDPGFIAMEYVDGHTLEEQLGNLELLQSGKSEPGGVRKGKKPKSLKIEDSSYIRRCVEVTAEVAEALDWAHQQGVIHRDIKPSNILIDLAGRVKITDFGIAMILESPAVTQDGHITGTYGYMSPEQIESGKVTIDHRTDVYSLGVVLYEMLTQKKPFTGENPVQILKQMHSGSIAPVHHLNSVVDKDLETICHKALEVNPENRYQSSAHLMADLRSWQRGEPILARPPSQLRKLKEKLYTRRSMIAVSLSSIGGVAAGSYWLSTSNDPRPVVDARQISQPLILKKIDLPTGRVSLKSIYSNGRIVDPEGSIFRLDPGLYRFSIRDQDSELIEYTRLLRLGDQVLIYKKPISNQGLETSMVLIDYPVSELIEKWRVNNYSRMPWDSGTEPFWIDQCETTCAEYLEYVQAENVSPPILWGGTNHPAGWERLPVTGITWVDAQGYAEWRGKRLPTIREWELAAMAPTGRLYPWSKKHQDMLDIIPARERIYEGYANLNNPRTEVGLTGGSRALDGRVSVFSDTKSTDLKQIQDYVYKSLWHVKESQRDIVVHESGSILHMLGNVAEWTETPGVTADASSRVSWRILGGMWSEFRSKNHNNSHPHPNAFTSVGRFSGQDIQQIGIGFRCARSYSYRTS